MIKIDEDGIVLDKGIDEMLKICCEYCIYSVNIESEETNDESLVCARGGYEGVFEMPSDYRCNRGEWICVNPSPNGDKVPRLFSLKAIYVLRLTGSDINIITPWF
jgi:hypothetical protein